MSKHIYLVHVSAVSIVAFCVSVVPAHAYVDPGSGSVIITTILGLFAAITYTFRRSFYKLRRFIRRDSAPVDQDPFTDDD